MALPEQDILQQGDVLAAQRNPGFETEGLPSPAGFVAPDLPAVAPIPIPGTGLTQENGQKSYLDQFNQSILGTQSRGLTPGTPPFYSVSDVYNPRYNSILPGEDSEEAFARGQHWSKQWGNAIVKMGATALGTFASGMMSIPDTIGAINGGTPYDSNMGNAIDGWLKNLEDQFPNYYTKWQQDHPFMSMIPFSGGFSNFWGDKFLKNLGFTIGAIGSAVVTDLAVSAATAGLGSVPVIGLQIGKASLWLNKIFTGTNRADQLLALGRAAGRTGEQLMDLKQLAQAAAATKVTNGARFAVNLYGSTAAEAGFEARDAYNTVKQDLIMAYQRDNGYSPTGEDLERLDKYARAAGNVRFGANMALIGISNTLQFDAFLKPFSAAKAGYRSALERQIAELGSIRLAEGSIDTFEPIVKKSLWGKIKPTATSVFTEGVWEEGGQYAAQVGIENFYERKYLYDKGISSEEYAKDETPWDPRDQIKNITHSIVEGLAAEFGTDEGLENVILGGLTGAAFGGVRRFMDKEKNREILATTLNLLNSTGVTGVLQNHYDNAASAHRITEDMKTAVKSNDVFKYKNFQHEQFVKFIMSGAKAGRFDVRMEQLELLKDMGNDDFKKAFGIDKTTENVELASDYVNALQSKAKAIKKSYDAINNNFINPFVYRPKGNTPEETLENQKYLKFEEWKADLTYLASINADVSQRVQDIGKIVGELTENRADTYHLANFTDRDYLKNYAANLTKEITGLKSLLDQKVSGDPEADRKRVRSLQSKVSFIDTLLSSSTPPPKVVESIFANLLTFHLNGQQDDGNTRLPQEIIPQLLEFGKDLNRLRRYRESAYEAFDKLSTQEGFERYFREAEIADEKYSNITTPPGSDGGSTSQGGPSSPTNPTPPKPAPLTIKGPEGKTRDVEVNQEVYVKTGSEPASPIEKVSVVSVDEEGVTVLKPDGTTIVVPPTNFFEDEEFGEEIDGLVDENTSPDDNLPSAGEVADLPGDSKKDISFGLYSTTDPVYTRKDIPFNNFHKRHQNFLFDLSSTDPDIFNQDNKPKLRIIPVTQATAVALNLPAGFAAPIEGNDVDSAIIRAVYVIDDTIDVVARNRQRDSIVRKVEKSTKIKSDIIKSAFRTNPDQAIQDWYEQALNAEGIEDQFDEDILDDIIDYSSQGLFYADSKGNKLGAVGQPADPNEMIFTTFASTSLTLASTSGVQEPRYTNKENIDETAAQTWWRNMRKDILSGTTAADAMQRKWQFSVSRGIPLNVTTQMRTPVVATGLISQADLDKSIITVPTLGNVAILGAFNEEGQGIAATKQGVKMPLGQPVLNFGGNMVFLNAREFTAEEANNIFDLLKIIADRNSTENKAPIFKYLNKIIQMGNPERGFVGGDSSITIQGANLFLGKRPNPIPLLPEALEEEKEYIVTFLKSSKHAIKNSEILRIQKNPKATDLEFVELKVENGKVEAANRFRNYNHYLLSGTNPPFTVNIPVPQEGERPIIQKYSTILDFDFDVSAFKTATKVITVSALPIELSVSTADLTPKSAVEKAVVDIKAKGGLTIENLDELENDYRVDNQRGSLTDENTSLLLGAINVLRTKLQDRNKQQAIEQQSVTSSEQEAPQEPLQFIMAGGKKFGFRIISRDTEGNVTDIDAVGVINDDGTITPYQRPEGVRSIIMNALKSSQSKQDETNNEEQKTTRDKFKGRNFKRGTDRYRMFHPGNSNYKRANLEQEYADVKAILPDFFQFQTLDSMIRTTGGGLAWGALQDSMIYVYKEAEVGTTYHEAFEAVWYHFLTGKEQDDLYKEFTGRKGTFTTYEGTVKSFGAASLKEAKEQLAEEFRDYKINKTLPKQPKQAGFFRRLINFIKKLLGMEVSDRNKLFKKVNKGYYRNYASSLRGPMTQPEYSYYREPGLEQFSETLIQDMLQGMTSELLGEVFGENAAIIDQLEENFKVASASIYDRLKSKLTYYFEDEVADTGTLLAEFGYEINNAKSDDDADAMISQMESIKEAWEKIKDNWEAFVAEHKRFLRVFNVEFVINDEGEADFAADSGATATGENVNMSEYDRDIMQYDAKNNASNRVKLLIASIADSEWVREATLAGMTAANSVRSKRESSIIRLPKLVQYAKLFNYLLHNTSGINGIYGIWGKMSDMTNDALTRKLIDANVRKLMNRVNFDRGFEGKTVSDVKTILSLENTLTKQKPSFFRQFVDFQRNTFFKTTVLNSKIDQVKTTWVTAMRGSAAVKIADQNKFMFTPAVVGISDNIEFLNRLGIEISRADVKRLRGANITKFNDAVNKIRSIVEKAAKDKVSVPIISSKQLDFDSRLNDLADLYVTQMVGDDTQSQHPNLDNEPTSNFVLNNFVSTIMNDANNSATREEFISRQDNSYLNDVFHKDSIILNKIMFDASGKKLKAIEVGVVEGRETWDKNNKSAFKLTEAERQLYEINNNLNGVFYTLLPADAKTEWALNVGTYLSADAFFGDDSSRSNEVTAFGTQMYKWLETEVALAKDYNNRKNIDALNRKIKGTDRPVGKSLRFFRDILPPEIVNDIHTKVVDGNTPLGDVISQTQMRALMREFGISKMNNTIDNLMSWNVISLSSNGNYALNGFDRAFLDKSFGKKSKYSRTELERLIMFREMNYVLNAIEMHKMFFGDPAQYKDELKRIKSFLSGREYTHVDQLGTSEGFNQWADSNLNKVGDVLLTPQDPGYQFFKNHFNTITIYDVFSESDQIDELKSTLGDAAEGYSEGNENDAGAYMMATSYREAMYKAGGRFTSAQEKQFQWEMAWERNDKAKEGKYTYSSKELERQDEQTLKQDPDTEVAFPILKLMHSGIQTVNGQAVVSLDKASWAPLFYRWYKGKGLEKIYNEMQRRGIDYARMESAHKVGIQRNSSMHLYDNEGNINSEAFDSIQAEAIPMKQIGVQVEQSKKEKGQTEGSQLRKIAIGDLRSNGVPIDFISKYKTEEEAYKAWESLETEEKRKQSSPIYTKIKRHDQALINLTTSRTLMAMKRLGMMENEAGSVVVPDKKMISDFILAELERRELPRNIASSIQISPETRDFSNPIEANPQYGKIRSIIYSILEKTVTRPKVNGGQKTLLSVTGFETSQRVVKRIVNEKPVYTASTLSFYKIGEDGTEACEIMLPYWFGKKLMAANSGKTKEEVIKYLNGTEEGRKILRGIGFRIPTQGLNSVDFFVVKDFLPEQMGDVIVFPAEITVKAGSDFDIDKMNVYLRNFYVESKTGLPKLLKYQGSEKETKIYLAKLIKDKDISNRELRLELKDYIEAETEGYEEGGLFESIPGAEELFSIDRIVEDFLVGREDNVIDMYYQKTLENEYFDSIEGLLSMPENFSRLVTPNDASELKGYRTKLLGLKSSSSTPLGDFGKLLDSTFMVKERQAYMASKQVVGISAISQTAHAISQNLPGGVVLQGNIATPRFPVNRINGKVSLSGLKIHGTDNLISNINSQTTDGGVDVAKDKFLAEMGINKDTLSTFLALVRMGAKPWWAILYLNQPAIQEFLKTKAIAESVSQINPLVKNEEDKILLLKTKIKFGGDNIQKKHEQPDMYNISQMESMIRRYSADPTSLTQEEKALQMMILDDFSMYHKESRKFRGYNALAWDLFKFYQGYNWDTATVNDPNLVRLKALKYERANLLSITPARKVIDNTFIGAMMQNILKLDEGLRSLINVQTGAAGSIMDQFASDIFKMRGSEDFKQQLLMIAELSMVDYSIQTNAEIEGKIVNSMIPSLLLSARSTAAYLEAMRRHPDKRISENPFIKAVIPILDKRAGYPSLVSMIERDYDSYTSNVLTDSFRELSGDATVISIDNNPENDRTVAQIYKRLVLTAMIQGGARSGRGGFSHLIPAETYTEYVSNALRNMQLGGFYENLVLYRANWNNPGLVGSATKEFVDELEEMDPLAEPHYMFFVNPNVTDKLAEIMNVDRTRVPMMLTQPSKEYRNRRVIKIEEFTRDENTRQIIDRKVRLFRRVDTYSERGLVPLQYDYNKVLFVEINAWGDQGIREFYSGQNQSVLPINNKVLEASDEQILYALNETGVKTNASAESIYYASAPYMTDFELLEAQEEDAAGNTEPVIDPAPEIQEVPREIPREVQQIADQGDLAADLQRASNQYLEQWLKDNPVYYWPIPQEKWANVSDEEYDEYTSKKGTRITMQNVDEARAQNLAIGDQISNDRNFDDGGALTIPNPLTDYIQVPIGPGSLLETKGFSSLLQTYSELTDPSEKEFLAEFIKEYGLGKYIGLISQSQVAPKNHSMRYTMAASENLTGKDTTTLDLIEQGLRTATTRSYALGKIGDLITFEDRPQVYRITKIEQLTDEKVKDPNWVKGWSLKEQWTEDHFRKVLGGQTVHIGSWQTTFEKSSDIISPSQREYTPENITTLPENGIFVFGSNTEGRHGAGAAKIASDRFGAIYGQAEGLQGRSYAIITKDLTRPKDQQARSVSLESIQQGISRFLEFARSSPDKRFYVTKLGSSLAGYSIGDIRALFNNVKASIPENVVLPREYEVRDSNLLFQVDSFEQFKNQLNKRCN